jgi:hypothetical protein
VRLCVDLLEAFKNCSFEIFFHPKGVNATVFLRWCIPDPPNGWKSLSRDKQVIQQILWAWTKIVIGLSAKGGYGPTD